MQRERLRLAAEVRGESKSALAAVLMRAGEANGVCFPAELLARSVELFEGAPCFVDHATPADLARAGGRSVRDLAGRVGGVAYVPSQQALAATLHLYAPARWLAALAHEAVDARHLGLSADLWVQREGKEVVAIEAVNSVDVVVNPAAGGRFLGASQTTEEATAMTEDRERERVQAGAGEPPAEEGSAASTGGEPEAEAALAAALRRELVEASLARAGLPPEVGAEVRRAVGAAATAEEIDRVIAVYRQAHASAAAQASIRHLGQPTGVREPLERLELAAERLLGLPETSEHREVPRLTGVRELYDLLTGDWERRGVFRGDRVQLATVNTTTLASVVANAMNKLLLRAYEARPQWWRPIAYEEDLTSMQQVRWITLGGFGALDAVAEGAAYTEKAWEATHETSDFVKRGNYVGVTLEMIDRDDVQALRAIPRRLALAAHRSLSAAVAGLFTEADGAGPLLADGHPLFCAEHGNLGGQALDPDSWDACIQAMFRQRALNTEAAMGLRPRYCLVPIELERQALTIFASDYAPEAGSFAANVRRNSSTVITVPEWSDVNDWAAAADPAELEGVCIGYRFGRSPEVFVADAETSGAMFTNDELRIKVRFVYAVGIGDYRALYKAVVA